MVRTEACVACGAGRWHPRSVRAINLLRVLALLAIIAVAFMIWLGRVGVAVGGGGLVAVVALAAVRGWHSKRKLDAAMRDADRP